MYFIKYLNYTLLMKNWSINNATNVMQKAVFQNANLSTISVPTFFMYIIFSLIYILHLCPKLKLRPILSLSSFVHNSLINEHKNMKLRENDECVLIFSAYTLCT